MDLKCKKLNCKHNNCYACMSNDIKVTNKCECATFEEADHVDAKQKQNIPKTMFETAPDMHPYRHNKLVGIKCDAKCLFNEDCHCKANGICVCNDDYKATCATFIEK